MPEGQRWRGPKSLAQAMAPCRSRNRNLKLPVRIRPTLRRFPATRESPSGLTARDRASLSPFPAQPNARGRPPLTPPPDEVSLMLAPLQLPRIDPPLRLFQKHGVQRPGERRAGRESAAANSVSAAERIRTSLPTVVPPLRRESSTTNPPSPAHESPIPSPQSLPLPHAHSTPAFEF